MTKAISNTGCVTTLIQSIKVIRHLPMHVVIEAGSIRQILLVHGCVSQKFA